MKKDYIKENIKLLTEWLRGLYGLFILIGSGVATLWVRKTFITYDTDGNILLTHNIDYYTFFTGVIFEVLIIVAIFIVNGYIHHNNKLLKQ